jgi:hypothetical protein
MVSPLSLQILFLYIEPFNRNTEEQELIHGITYEAAAQEEEVYSTVYN